MHNITVEPGPITLSDHIPMIITLTTKVVNKKISMTLDMRKANWNSFRDQIERNMKNKETFNHMNKDTLDRKIEEWYNIVENNINPQYLKKTKQMTQKPIATPQLKYIQHLHAQLQIEIKTQGLDLHKYYRKIAKNCTEK